MEAEAPDGTPVIAARPGAAAGGRRRRDRARRGSPPGRRAPGVMAGSGLYWGHGEHALQRLCDELRVPVALNGLARGCVPPDHDCYVSRARGAALKGADVAIVIGVPMDFRLGFGGRLRRGHEAHRALRRAALESVPARDRGGALRRHPPHARRPPRGRRRRPGPVGLDRLAPRGGAGAARRGADGAGGLPLAAASDARLRRAAAGDRPRHDRHRGRRRLRVLRRPPDRDPPARLLDGSGPVRLPRQRAGLRHRRRSRTAGSAHAACSSATAHSASPGSSSTRWCATTCRSWP